MMHDPLDPRNEPRTPSAEPRTPTEAEASATDREVPIEARKLPTQVHAFLDGDVVSEASLAGAERELELWKLIGAETGRRRRMVTPAHVPMQILAKLSDD